MEGYSKEEIAQYVVNYLNKDRKYLVDHKYQSARDGKERLMIEEL